MIRYQLALLAHSQRYLPPLLIQLAVFGILYGDANAQPLPEFTVSAGALTVVACWLTIALVDAEDPVQRLVTLSHAGRRRWTLVTAVVLAVLVCAGCLTAVSLAWSALSHGGLAAGDLGLGVLAHLACAAAGIAVGLPCSKLVTARIGWTVVLAFLGLTALILVRWIPVINPMLRALAGRPNATAAVLVSTAAAVVLLLLSGAVTALVATRRS
ncbi:hypothetical protein [Amycolatopsis suaedae]|uniref:ABC transporter n=1 Tax=Amycolatopsis suaedae TaxID=2510978 RepID=A0A4Q7JD31_9PSEU|nr:hypothetical protein [Amycolatopsis suaedae]RZQ64972.1 hypothetical protein EWH70_03410 [Amycolatopsis suaedae]